MSKKIKVKNVEFVDDIVNFLTSEVEKKFGKYTILKLSDDVKKVKCIFSSGIPSLDDILGIGGYPVGRIMEIVGSESSGKTTLALHAAAECHKIGGIVTFIDAEHALDVNYASNLGVNVDKLLLNQPDNGEQVFGIMETILQIQKNKNCTKPLLIIVDSVASIIPKSELEGEEVGAGALGAHARLMSQGLKRLGTFQKDTNSFIIFINQIRYKIGVKFGNPETSPGGNALKFYSTIRLDIRTIGKEKVGDDIVGNKTRIKIIKNKIAPPFKQFETIMRYGIGIDLFYEKLIKLINSGKIIKAGSWYSILETGEKLGQGVNAVRQLDKEDPDIFDNLLEK